MICLWTNYDICGKINKKINSKFEEILDYYFVNRAIWLDYKCKDKNAMYNTKCTRAGR